MISCMLQTFDEINFHGDGVDVLLDSTYYGYVYFLGGFVVLDVNNELVLIVFLLLHLQMLLMQMYDMLD